MPSAISYNNDNFDTLLLTLQNKLGVVVPESQHGDILERIMPLLSAHKLGSLEVLSASLERELSGEITADILDVISRSQSSWQLNESIRDVLRNYLFEQMPENARVWIAGCEQGQMAFSIAMELAKYENETGLDKKLRLIATDISAADITFAEQAIYSKHQLAGLDEDNLKQFVTINDGKGEVKEKIRRLISFKQHDLTACPQSLGEMDLIICPSVLVYFSNDIKADVIRHFAEVLKPGGVLLTDNTQPILMAANGMERVAHPVGVFYRKVA